MNTKLKQTEIGGIPEGWKISKFEDIAYSSKEVFNPNTQHTTMPYLGLEHFVEGGYSLNGLGKSTDVHSNKLRFKKNDVLFGKLRPYFKKIFSPDFDGVCSTDIWVLRANEEIDQKFLYFFVGSDKFLAKAIESSEGTKMPRAMWNFVSNQKYVVPPINEQQKIASILSSLDDKIELNRKMNKTLEDMAKALFERWFVDFEFPDERGYPYRSSGGEMVESELGMIPKEWKTTKINRLIDFLEGPGIRNWQYSVMGTKFINIRLINGGDIDVSSANCINQKDVIEKYQHFLLREMDMVVSTSGTLGKSAIVRNTHLPLLLNTSVIRFRPINQDNYPYMYQYLQSRYFLEEQTRLASGSVQANFGPTHLNQMAILNPDSELLSNFNMICRPIYEYILMNMNQNDALNNARDYLLPKMMIGKIRV